MGWSLRWRRLVGPVRWGRWRVPRWWWLRWLPPLRTPEWFQLRPREAWPQTLATPWSGCNLIKDRRARVAERRAVDGLAWNRLLGFLFRLRRSELMTRKQIFRITAAALWTALTTPCLAIASPQQSGETVGQTVPAAPGINQNESLPELKETAWAPTSGPFENPFAPYASSATREDRDTVYGAAAAAPPAYPPTAPAPPTSSSSWAPTHFEIYGLVQWRNLSSNSGFSSSYCLPSGCVTNTGSFRDNLGLTGFGVGPNFGFIWTPEKKILRAKSKVWVEYGQLDRSKTRNISGSIDFLGFSYAVNTTLEAQLNEKLFSLGYSPHWGNDKFGIGPEIVYQHLGFDFILTNLTPGAPPPIKQSLNTPNNLAIMGVDFD